MEGTGSTLLNKNKEKKVRFVIRVIKESHRLLIGKVMVGEGRLNRFKYGELSGSL